MTHNEIDHGLPTEAEFFLLNQEGRRYFHTSDAAIEAWKPGDVVMTEDHYEPADYLPGGKYCGVTKHIVAGRAE